MKLLLVEDNPMNRDMLSRRLKRRNYEVIEAGDGKSALAVARVAQPDLILMDLSLPKLDGWETTRQLRLMPETAAIPIIALSAHALSDDSDKAISAGCDDYDTKPIDLERLIGKIERHVDRDGAPAARGSAI